MKEITVVIFSASRSDLLEQTLSSVKKNLIFNGELRWMLHEDAEDTNNDESIEEIKELNALPWKKMIGEVYPIGLVRSVGRMLEFIDTEYMLWWADDIVATDKIYLTSMYNVMEKNESINQLCILFKGIRGERPIIKIGGKSVTVMDRWKTGPAIWRMSFIKPLYRCHENWHSWARYINEQVPQDKLGSYIWGVKGDKIKTKHIGEGRSAR